MISQTGMGLIVLAAGFLAVIFLCAGFVSYHRYEHRRIEYRKHFRLANDPLVLKRQMLSDWVRRIDAERGGQ